MTEFIASREDITAEWLTGTLREGGRLSADASVEDVTVAKVGTGQMGACYLVRPTFSNGTDAPSRLIAKLPSEDEGSRTFAAGLEAYTREVRFYQHLADEVGVRTPECYYAAHNDDGTRFVLLLEDLSPATECGQIEGCSHDQARIALEQAAALHGSSWHDDRLADAAWLRTGLNVWRSFGPSAEGIQQGLRARYGGQLEEEYLRIGDRLAAGALSRWLERLEAPRCLWHSDYRLDNMLFDASGGSVPFAVVDWQSVTMADGTIDASYFVGAGLTLENRREHEEELIRGYHQALLAHGAEGYGWDDCWWDYRVNAISGYVVAAVSSISVEQTERGDQMFLTMLRRHGQQILDHGALVLIDA